MATFGSVTFTLPLFLFGFHLFSRTLAIKTIPDSFHSFSSLHRNLSVPINQGNAKTSDYVIVRLPNKATPSSHFPPAFIVGLRVEEADKGVTYNKEGIPVVLAGSLVTMRLFGGDLSYDSQFRFVLEVRERGADCDDLPFTVNRNISQGTLTDFSALITLRLPSLDQLGVTVTNDSTVLESPTYYVCSMGHENGHRYWIHQGKEPGVKLKTFQCLLPLWLHIVMIIILLLLSGLFSGLNLGLMALDKTDLEIYENTGSEKERRYARAIIPVRKHGNYLLCTILLGNVLVNTSLTILMDDLTSGILAVVGSTIVIVVFGEITPQAVCSRYGLAAGAHTIWITKFFMLITFPLSYPISFVLNWILGEETGAYYNRERLKELIKVTSKYHDLEKEEIDIISGALEMRKKTVSNIMTRLEDVFMLSADSVLDYDTVCEILKQGFSRVPIYEGARTNVIGLLFIKHLALADPEDAIPLKSLCRYYQKQDHLVFEDATLDVVFKDFKAGIRSHMAFVQRVNHPAEDREQTNETVGLITWGDIIDELVCAKTVDEKNPRITDNGGKVRREKSIRLLREISNFAVQYRTQSTHKISPQLQMSAFQFLSTTINAFGRNWISEKVLRRLIQQGPIFQFIRINPINNKSSLNPEFGLIYQQGEPADYFVLILEGKVQVTVGCEKLVFESGPFSYFGLQAINSIDQIEKFKSPVKYSRNGKHYIRGFSFSEGGKVSDEGGKHFVHQMFISDYTVRALSDVTYLRVNRFLYQAAVSASLLEKAQNVHPHTKSTDS